MQIRPETIINQTEKVIILIWALHNSVVEIKVSKSRLQFYLELFIN